MKAEVKHKPSLTARRRAVLLKVINTFSKGPRSIKHGTKNTCLYAGPRVNGVNTGCAIGILIPRRIGRRLDGMVNTSVVSDHVFCELPKGVQELGKEFLFDLQSLHDYPWNWENPDGSPTGGLSRAGKARVRKIKRDHGL